MKSKIKVWLVLFFPLQLACFLFLNGILAAEPPIVAGTVLNGETFLPVAIPEKDRLKVVSTAPLIVDGDTIGTAHIYDDPATKRPADYLELYNRTGVLLAVAWFDQFGIERMVIDRGVVEDSGGFEGVFVIVLDGDSL